VSVARLGITPTTISTIKRLEEEKERIIIGLPTAGCGSCLSSHTIPHQMTALAT
jgi:hypothetical protein